MCSDPQNARFRISFTSFGLTRPSVRAEPVEALFRFGQLGFSVVFRCRSVAAAGDSLFFASPKKSKQKKGDPGVCVPSLRYGQPAVLASGGVSCKLASLKQARALIRLKLRSSAHSQGFGEQIRMRIRIRALHVVATIFIAAYARNTGATALKCLRNRLRAIAAAPLTAWPHRPASPLPHP